MFMTPAEVGEPYELTVDVVDVTSSLTIFCIEDATRIFLKFCTLEVATIFDEYYANCFVFVNHPVRPAPTKIDVVSYQHSVEYGFADFGKTLWYPWCLQSASAGSVIPVSITQVSYRPKVR